MIFDCDATLSAIEGIDELAKNHPSEALVSELTEAAMSGSVALEDVYGRRLKAIEPTDVEIRQVSAHYKRNVVSHARDVVSALRHHGHDVYIVSGGLADPVREFATFLGIDQNNVRAVEVAHDRLDGSWWLSKGDAPQRFDDVVNDRLATANGKVEVIEQLLDATTGGSALIGDGATDLAASGVVDSFIGFGGVSNRPQIAEQAEIYINCACLSPVFPLVGGSAVLAELKSDERSLLDKGLKQIEDGEVAFASSLSKQQFTHAFYEESQL